MKSRHWLIATVVIVVTCTSASAASYEYGNLFNASHTITIQTDPPIVAANDRAVEARFCRPSDAFFCVSSEIFRFAIPAQKKKRSSPWRLDGADYLPKAKTRMLLLDRYVDVLVVESVQDARRLRYLYSDRYGLVAFGVDVDGQTEVFLSQRKTGFAGR